MFDAVVIGAGPGGLQTALFTASEGVKTAIISPKIGGQIGDTPRLENFAGQCVGGVSGGNFMQEVFNQTQAFGATYIADEVVSLEKVDGYYNLTLKAGKTIQSKTVVIATGLTYIKPDIAGIDSFMGSMSFLGPFMCVKVKKEETYVVIGAGNSAGQAIMELSEHAKHVYVIARTEVNMSAYLVERIRSRPNITVLTHSICMSMKQDCEGFCVTIVNQENKSTDITANYMFVCAGNVPNTSAFPAVTKDRAGFVVVNNFQTNLDGVFAIGDVRTGVVRRSVANAVGDAATVATMINQYLAANKVEV